MRARLPGSSSLGAVLLAALGCLAACASRPDVELELQPYFAPSWTPAAGGETRRLVALGAVAGAPFGTLEEALRAVDAMRSERAPARLVHVVHRAADGWQAHAFREEDYRRVLLRELGVDGLPLAIDPLEPHTFLVDSEHAVGRLVRSAAGYAIAPVRPNADGELVLVLEPDHALRIHPLPRALALRDPSLSSEPVHGFLVADRGWQNHAQNVQWRPSLLFRPGRDIGVLARGLRWVDAHLPAAVPVRAIGSRHAWSRVAEGDGVSVLPHGSMGFELAREATEDSGRLYRVLAGMRIRELNAGLHERGDAMPYLGGFDGQTMGGVFATGTHGSVLGAGPLADLIRSIDLVTFEGELLRFEPSRARITSEEELSATTPPRRLVLDDAAFDAVRIGLGCFGVIHSLVLETVPRYWLREVRTVVSFDELRAALRGGAIAACFLSDREIWAKLRNPRVEPRAARPTDPVLARLLAEHPFPAFHFEVLWSPYEDAKALVTTRHWIDVEQQRSYEEREPAGIATPRVRNFWRWFGPRSPYERPGLTEPLSGEVGVPATDLVERLAEILPWLVPATIETTITALDDPAGYTQRSYRVFNIGDQTNLLPSLSATISVPLRDDLWLRATEIVHGVAREMLKQEGIVQTGPISLRFVRGSTALLAEDEAVCKLEVIFGGRSERTQRNANRLVAAYYHALRKELGDVVRLHLGQIIPPGTYDAVDPLRTPPFAGSTRYEAWRRLRDELDPRARGLTPWLRSILPPTR